MAAMTYSRQGRDIKNPRPLFGAYQEKLLSPLWIVTYIDPQCIVDAQNIHSVPQSSHISFSTTTLDVGLVLLQQPSNQHNYSNNKSTCLLNQMTQSKPI